MKLGIRLGSAIQQIITIVHPRTFARWLSEGKSGIKRRKRGRPRKPEKVRQLIVEMAKARADPIWEIPVEMGPADS
jgi:putative transposase